MTFYAIIHANVHRRRWSNRDNIDLLQSSAPRARFIDNIERLLLENRIEQARPIRRRDTFARKRSRRCEIKSQLRVCFVINSAGEGREGRGTSGSFEFRVEVSTNNSARSRHVCMPEEADAFGEREARESERWRKTTR